MLAYSEEATALRNMAVRSWVLKKTCFFGLETEIELMAPTKFQDVNVVIPAGLLKEYGGIECRNSEFQNTPK